MKKALITGALGQDGRFLAEHLKDLGYEVFGLARRTADRWDGRACFVISPDRMLYGDMRDESSLYEAVIKTWPDEIYNLAAVTFPPASWQYSWKVFDTNAGGLARLLEIVEKAKPETKIFQASTADQFGPVEGPCNEETPMNPGTPYGVSKLAAHKLAQLYRKKGMYVSTCILFNHDSSLRSAGFVTKKIIDHLVEFTRGRREKLQLGYLDGKRDWGYAGDYVRAMHLSLQQGASADYVIGTGIVHSVREFLDLALTCAGVDQEEFHRDWLISDSRLKRPNETQLMCADFTKARVELGWSSMTSFERMVKWMVEDALRAEVSVT